MKLRPMKFAAKCDRRRQGNGCLHHVVLKDGHMRVHEDDDKASELTLYYF